MRAGKHEVAQETFADDKEDGNKDKVESGRLLVPGQTTVRQ